MVSIGELPLEMLDVILRLVDPKRGTLRFQLDKKQFLHPPHRFPYNVANVCTIWRDVLSHYPKLWTHLDVFVDAVEPTPLSQLKLYLLYSKDLPLHLSVTRTYSRLAKRFHPENEGRTKAVIKMLRPHFSRCTSIEFSLMRGSLLPSFSRDLRNLSTQLTRVGLECEFDDQHPIVDLKFDYNEDNEFKWGEYSPRYEKLMTLSLGGYTILDALEHAPSLIQSASLKVQLHNYTSTALERVKGGDNVVTLLKTLLIDNHEAVFIDNVNLHHLEGRPTIYFPIHSGLSLRNLESEMLRNIFELGRDHNGYGLYIANSVMPPICSGYPLSDDSSLCLVEVEGDLGGLLSDWVGNDLDVYRCEGFDDQTAKLLASRMSDEEVTLDSIGISECHSLTLEGLRQLAQACRSGSIKVFKNWFIPEESDALSKELPNLTFVPELAR